MRKIKFRAKAIYQDEWIYGHFCFASKAFGLPHDTPSIQQFNVDETQILCCRQIDPDTLGQFTGLHDKNGKDIYFDDIVRNKYGDIGSVIWFSDWTLRVDWGGGDIHFIDPEWGLEVIGNIHDNPELLKTE